MKKLLLLCGLLYFVSGIAATSFIKCPAPKDLRFEKDQYVAYSNYGKWVTVSGRKTPMVGEISLTSAYGFSNSDLARQNRIFDRNKNNIECYYASNINLNPEGNHVILGMTKIGAHAKMANNWRQWENWGGRFDNGSACSDNECTFAIPLEDYSLNIENQLTTPINIEMKLYAKSGTNCGAEFATDHQSDILAPRNVLLNTAGNKAYCVDAEVQFDDYQVCHIYHKQIPSNNLFINIKVLNRQEYNCGTIITNNR